MSDWRLLATATKTAKAALYSAVTMQAAPLVQKSVQCGSAALERVVRASQEKVAKLAADAKDFRVWQRERRDG